MISIQTVQNFVHKYAIQFGKLVPVADYSKSYSDSYFLGNTNAFQIRKYDISKVFNNRRKKEADISYGILDLLNELFDACCTLAILWLQSA